MIRDPACFSAEPVEDLVLLTTPGGSLDLPGTVPNWPRQAGFRTGVSTSSAFSFPVLWDFPGPKNEKAVLALTSG